MRWSEMSIDALHEQEEELSGMAEELDRMSVRVLRLCRQVSTEIAKRVTPST